MFRSSNVYRAFFFFFLQFYSIPAAMGKLAMSYKVKKSSWGNVAVWFGKHNKPLLKSGPTEDFCLWETQLKGKERKENLSVDGNQPKQVVRNTLQLIYHHSLC